MELRDDTIVVTGLGMVSSLGHNVITSCAAARAGVSRESGLDYLSIFEEESAELAPVVGHAITGFTEGFVGLGRLVRMGVAALNELLSHAKLSDHDFSKTGLFINLSSGYYMNLLETEERKAEGEQELDENDAPFEVEIRRKEYQTSLISQLCKLTNMQIDNNYQKIYFSDHVGIIIAVKDAIDLLQRRELDRCIIGGIDSYVEKEAMEIFSDFGVLKTVENPEGFVPGEAAAFILIERHKTAYTRNACIEGILEFPFVTSESIQRVSEEPSNGRALSESILETMNCLSDKGKNIGLIIGNLNGDRFKANEWGNALVRISSSYPFNNVPEWYPAVSFGDTGSATAAICICMGIRGIIRDYIKTDGILIWSSSDDGHKGSIYLRKYNM